MFVTNFVPQVTNTTEAGIEARQNLSKERWVCICSGLAVTHLCVKLDIFVLLLPNNNGVLHTRNKNRLLGNCRGSPPTQRHKLERGSGRGRGGGGGGEGEGEREGEGE